jgi:hypothetical protein
MTRGEKEKNCGEKIKEKRDMKNSKIAKYMHACRITLCAKISFFRSGSEVICMLRSGSRSEISIFPTEYHIKFKALSISLNSNFIYHIQFQF